MDWFRMYHEFATDPKVQSMSEAMQRRLMMLFCLRCSNTLVTLQETEIAFALRINEEDLAETKVLFLRKNFIDDDWNILQWDERQFVSDSSAPRVARHRAKVKAAAKAGQEHACNVTVTPQIQNRTDTEQNREKQKNHAQPVVALPDWLPMPSWLGYLEMRKKKQKIPTDRAIELVILELQKLRDAGHDIAIVLDKSTVNGWTDVYALKDDLKVKNSHAWWASDATILAKGVELGLKPNMGEFMPQFKGRIELAIANAGKPPPKPTMQIAPAAEPKPDISDANRMAVKAAAATSKHRRF